MRCKKKSRRNNKKLNNVKKKRRKFIKKNSDPEILESIEAAGPTIPNLEDGEKEVENEEIDDIQFQAVRLRPRKVSLAQAIFISKIRRDRRQMNFEIDQICDMIQDKLSNREENNSEDQVEHPIIEDLSQHIRHLDVHTVPDKDDARSDKDAGHPHKDGGRPHKDARKTRAQLKDKSGLCKYLKDLSLNGDSAKWKFKRRK
eukprot:TRINITY_DN36988_c0_g1_i1.p1 TRINITY_DN36988_c0_g1~~TRINITY_DN36988_c0_g1_i1.p1  ORF type:complete len:201 (+),score=39.50 TRINITY_DN36988_c0_g1_i1:109-711(+)